jgi:hypothetical protein
MAKSIEHCAEEIAADELGSMLQEFTALKLDLGQRYR